MSEDIRLLRATQAQIPAIVDLWEKQNRRQYELDTRLQRPRSVEQMRIFLQNQNQNDSAVFIAVDGQLHVRGYVAPARWDLSANSVLHAFLSPQNGITEALILPDPEEEDAEEVGRSLLHFLSAWWKEKKTTGDLIRWPTSDSWFGPLLKEQGFVLDSHCAIRAMGQLAPASYHLPEVTIRVAKSEDEEELVSLFLGEMTIHAETVACSRISEVALQGFRSKLRNYWRQKEEKLFILVAEQRERGVVGMAENVVITVESDEAPGFTPPGSYGCLDNVSVKPEFQGQGIGRLLVDESLGIFSRHNPDTKGAILWYNPDNPSAGRFWPRLGFHDIWTTYQRLRPVE